FRTPGATSLYWGRGESCRLFGPRLQFPFWENGGMKSGIQWLFSERFPSRVVGMSLIAEIIDTTERTFADLLDHAPIALAVLQNTGTITAFNPAFGQLLRLGPGTISITLSELVSPANRPEVDRLLVDLFEVGGDGFQCQSQ